MQVTLLHSSPLEVVVKAIRKCYASEDKSDSHWEESRYDSEFRSYDAYWKLGPKDKALIQRIIQSGHTSTIEHLSFTFDIGGLSRAALQELARHRHTSLSVKSTRYTLGELSKAKSMREFLVETGYVLADEENCRSLASLQTIIQNQRVSNDQIKYMLPEAFKTSLIWTINARSLRNFLKLRSDKRALWEMQELAKAVFELIPKDMKFIFQDVMSNIEDYVS